MPYLPAGNDFAGIPNLGLRLCSTIRVGVGSFVREDSVTHGHSKGFAEMLCNVRLGRSYTQASATGALVFTWCLFCGLFTGKRKETTHVGSLSLRLTRYSYANSHKYGFSLLKDSQAEMTV